MSLWSNLRDWADCLKIAAKKKCPFQSQSQAAEGKVPFASGAMSLEMAAQRDPKAAVLLALLWQSDTSSLSSKRSKFDAPRPALANGATWPFTQSAQGRQEAHSLGELVTFIDSHTPNLPPTETERAEALVLGISTSLYHNLRELRQTDEVFPILHLSDAVRISGALRLAELHKPLCRLLVGAQEVIRADRDGPRIAPLESLCRSVQAQLAALPPNAAPVLWQMLRDPTTSEQFWPVLQKMRQPSAVPYLLDVIPALSPEGKASVVVALQNIGDARAIPYLQHLRQTQTGTLAALAANAIAHILRHSQGDAVQLLRASGAGNSDRAGETLLRPVQPAGQNAAPKELLRPAESPLQSAGMASSSDRRKDK